MQAIPCQNKPSVADTYQYPTQTNMRRPPHQGDIKFPHQIPAWACLSHSRWTISWPVSVCYVSGWGVIHDLVWFCLVPSSLSSHQRPLLHAETLRLCVFCGVSTAEHCPLSIHQQASHHPGLASFVLQAISDTYVPAPAHVVHVCASNPGASRKLATWASPYLHHVGATRASEPGQLA